MVEEEEAEKKTGVRNLSYFKLEKNVYTINRPERTRGIIRPRNDNLD